MVEVKQFSDFNMMEHLYTTESIDPSYYPHTAWSCLVAISAGLYYTYVVLERIIDSSFYCDVYVP